MNRPGERIQAEKKDVFRKNHLFTLNVGCTVIPAKGLVEKAPTDGVCHFEQSEKSAF